MRREVRAQRKILRGAVCRKPQTVQLVEVLHLSFPASPIRTPNEFYVNQPQCERLDRASGLSTIADPAEKSDDNPRVAAAVRVRKSER